MKGAMGSCKESSRQVGTTVPGSMEGNQRYSIQKQGRGTHFYWPAWWGPYLALESITGGSRGKQDQARDKVGNQGLRPW